MSRYFLIRLRLSSVSRKHCSWFLFHSSCISNRIVCTAAQCDTQQYFEGFFFPFGAKTVVLLLYFIDFWWCWFGCYFLSLYFLNENLVLVHCRRQFLSIYLLEMPFCTEIYFVWFCGSFPSAFVTAHYPTN